MKKKTIKKQWKWKMLKHFEIKIKIKREAFLLNVMETSYTKQSPMNYKYTKRSDFDRRPRDMLRKRK